MPPRSGHYVGVAWHSHSAVARIIEQARFRGRHNELQYFVAGFGRWEERRLALDLALQTSELPGTEWWMADQRVLRTATTMRARPEDGAVFERARRSGGFSVTRLFTQREPYRALMCRVAKYASSQDAEFVVEQTQKLMALNPTSARGVIEFSAQRTMTNIVVPGVDGYQAVELDANGPQGLEAISQLSANVGSIYFMVRGVSRGESHSWEDVLAVCDLQVAKIRSHPALAESDASAAQP